MLSNARLLLACCCLTAACVVFAAKPTKWDVVSMKNGDIHNGSLAIDAFTLDSPYGGITLPYANLTSIRFGVGNESDRLSTTQGERFYGRIRRTELRIDRVLDPPLRLSMSEIADISFAARPTTSAQRTLPDSLLTNNGDRFAVELLDGDIRIETQSGTEQIAQADIHFIDIVALSDGEDHLARITRNDREALIGKLTVSSLPLATRYGDTLHIPLQQIASLALQVNHGIGKPLFNLRRRLNPAHLIHDSLSDGRAGPAMLTLRGGRFIRGDAAGDSDEKPPKPLKLSPFAIGVQEVSFSEYDEFCEQTGRAKPDDSEWGRGARPVVNVSWNDAMAYAQWLSGKTGRRYRLPSDAEWEYAARAGSTTRFWWGDEVTRNRANCEGCGSPWDGEQSAPTGMFPPNAFGLHDTAGNVFEWVADCWQGDFEDAPENGAPMDKPGCVSRVIRGGAWSFPPHEIRSANRWRDFASRRSDDTGFRLARDLD